MSARKPGIPVATGERAVHGQALHDSAARDQAADGPARGDSPSRGAAGGAPISDAAAPLFVARLAVRWRDLDAFNHVNNSSYLTYLEEARLQWLQNVHDWMSADAVPVLASSELQYRRPIAWPATLHIELRCERLGNSSITLSHRIIDAANARQSYSDGRVVMVWIDPATGKPVPLPSTIRAAAGHAGD